MAAAFTAAGLLARRWPSIRIIALGWLTATAVAAAVLVAAVLIT